MKPARSFLNSWLIMGLYALVVLGPMLVLGTQTVQVLLSGHLEWFNQVPSVGRLLGLLVNSVSLALGVGLISSLMGWLAAVWLWSRRSRYAWLVVLLALPLSALPVYIYALSWFAGAEQLTNLLNILGFLQGLRPNWFSVLLVEVSAYLPLTSALAWLGLRNIHPDMIESARLARSDLLCLLKVGFPLSAPTLFCAGGVIFLLCLLDYSVPSLLQVQVYPMEIFADFSANHSPERAFLLSAPLIAIATLGLFTLLKPLRALVVNAAFYDPAWGTNAEWPAWFGYLLAIGAVCLILSLCLPFIISVTLLDSPNQAIASWLQAVPEVGTSLVIACSAALISLLLATLTAGELLSLDRFSWLKWGVVLAPLSIPASLTGIGLISITQLMASRLPAFNLLPAVLACLTRYAPFAVLMMVAQLRRQDTLLLDAARVLQKKSWRRLLWVRIPLTIASMLIAVGLVFALSLGELGATLMVIPPGQATVSMRLYNYLHYGASDVVAGLSLIMVTAVIMVNAIVVSLAWIGWRRFNVIEAGR